MIDVKAHEGLGMADPAAYDFTQADRDDEASHWKAVSGPVGGTGSRLVSRKTPTPLRAWLDGDATQSVVSALFGAFAAGIVVAIVMLLACGGSR